ncbi:MAG: hypothetical protein DWQ45_17070 [Planctomycetota bacterium]|nr:MAG: hypothetical protein DWQ41_15935 [Planctomycetota bacterium]REK32460.1 MAG: hypothetical protein DWQ45_17070 [Planctomycetota bacterium]
MDPRVEEELKRIVGGEGVTATDIETESPANRRLRLETAQAVYEVPAGRGLIFLQQLPDDIGVEALRQAIEQEFPGAGETARN